MACSASMHSYFLSFQTALRATEPTPKVFWLSIAFFVALALVPTIWTEVDLAAAALFVGENKVINAGHWPWVVWINAYIPTVFRWLVLLAFAGWLFTTLTRYKKNWRLCFAFIALAVIVGPGAVVNHVFKDNWQRARPYQVTQFDGAQEFTRAGVFADQCDNNCSFVSGHVACGFFLMSLMLLHRKRAVAWTAVGLIAGLLIGFSRMADVAHWLSDVLWAGPITLITSWIVWKLLLICYHPTMSLEPCTIR